MHTFAKGDVIEFCYDRKRDDPKYGIVAGVRLIVVAVMDVPRVERKEAGHHQYIQIEGHNKTSEWISAARFRPITP